LTLPTDRDDLQIEKKLQAQVEKITDRFCAVYHISSDEAMRRLHSSSFYSALSNMKSGLLDDSEYQNFLRLQNEIEYGDWRL